MNFTKTSLLRISNRHLNINTQNVEILKNIKKSLPKFPLYIENEKSVFLSHNKQENGVESFSFTNSVKINLLELSLSGETLFNLEPSIYWMVHQSTLQPSVEMVAMNQFERLQLDLA